jgi:hypothetical protein
MMVVGLAIVVMLLLLSPVVWAGWRAGEAWQFIPNPIEPATDQHLICSDGIIFGLADETDRGLYRVVFYDATNMPPDESTLPDPYEYNPADPYTELGQRYLQEGLPAYPPNAKHSLCQDATAFEAGEPAFCGGPYFVGWTKPVTPGRTTVSAWLFPGAGEFLDNGRPMYNPYTVGNCTALPIELKQTSSTTDSAIVTEALVFQVRVLLAPLSDKNGEGIKRVIMSILDADGSEIHRNPENDPKYCAFGGTTDCTAWDFAQNNYEWPNGTLIENGPHTLRAVALPDNSGNNGDSKTADFPIQIQLPIVNKLLQTGPGSTAALVTQALVFQVEAYVGPRFSDGKDIDKVIMSIIDPDGQEVYKNSKNNAAYCAFGGGGNNNPNCNIWNFSANDYRWPNGTPLKNGPHLLKADIQTNDGRSEVVTFPIQIKAQLPIVTNLVQSGPGTTATDIAGAVVFQMAAQVGLSSSDGAEIANVDMRIIDPEGNEVHQSVDTQAKYCAFGGSPDCQVWSFADHNNQWPGGQAFQSGTHILRAIVNTADDRSETVDSPVIIRLPGETPFSVFIYLPMVRK